MLRIVTASVAFVLFATTTVVAGPKISGQDARKIALAKVPGAVVHEKLKHKKHGHDLYYFKIKPTVAKGAPAPAMWKKVEVDSETGQVTKIKDTKPKGGADKDD